MIAEAVSIDSSLGHSKVVDTPEKIINAIWIDFLLGPVAKQKCLDGLEEVLVDEECVNICIYRIYEI